MLGQWWVNPEDLDDEQQKAVALPFDKDHLVTGPPGSGKTNLLVLRATNLIRNTVPNVLMLVFNRTLEEFIANCPTPYSLPRDRLSTLTRWEMQLINQLGGVPASKKKFKEMRLENCATLTDLVIKQGLHRIYDVVLLDESQDYLVDEIALVLRLAKNVFAVGDDQQRIYDHPSPLPDLKTRCNVHQLSHHYRNGHRICEVADRIGSNWQGYTPLLPTSQYNERTLPSKVTVTQCANIAEQAKLILKDVDLQLKAYPNEMIGVICPRHKEVQAVYEAFQGAGFDSQVVYQNSESGYLPFSADKRVCICTLHSAKGLEFRATHIAGAEHMRKFRDRQWRMAYTGVTRAKTILCVYHSERLPPYLESGLAAIVPGAKPTGFADLFKAK